MTAGNVSQQFGQQLEPHKHRPKRIVGQITGAAEKTVKDVVFFVDVAIDQRMGEGVLVREMTREAAFRDRDRHDDLVDRSGFEALGQNGILRDIEDALADRKASQIGAHRSRVSRPGFPYPRSGNRGAAMARN